MTRLVFAPEVIQAYESLDKAGAAVMLDAIDDAFELLRSDPGGARARRRSFTGGAWGIPVRDRSDNWVIVWERDSDDDDLVRVRYLGADPFA